MSTLDLAEVGSIGLHGPDAHHLASTLVAQLASAVGPEDVALAVVVQPNRAGQWRWVAALPHVRSAAELLDGPATAGAGGHHTLVAAVSALGAARQHNTTSPGDRPPSRVPLVLVLDGEVGGLIETRRLAELCRLGAVGIHVLWLERRPSHTPLGCSATVTTVRKGMATVVSVPGAEPKQVRWESLPDDRLERLAHHLAPRRDGDRAGTGAGFRPLYRWRRWRFRRPSKEPWRRRSGSARTGRSRSTSGGTGPMCWWRARPAPVRVSSCARWWPVWRWLIHPGVSTS